MGSHPCPDTIVLLHRQISFSLFNQFCIRQVSVCRFKTWSEIYNLRQSTFEATTVNDRPLLFNTFALKMLLSSYQSRRKTRGREIECWRPAKIFESFISVHSLYSILFSLDGLDVYFILHNMVMIILLNKIHPQASRADKILCNIEQIEKSRHTLFYNFKNFSIINLEG